MEMQQQTWKRDSECNMIPTSVHVANPRSHILMYEYTYTHVWHGWIWYYVVIWCSKGHWRNLSFASEPRWRVATTTQNMSGDDNSQNQNTTIHEHRWYTHHQHDKRFQNMSLDWILVQYCVGSSRNRVAAVCVDCSTREKHHAGWSHSPTMRLTRGLQYIQVKHVVSENCIGFHIRVLDKSQSIWVVWVFSTSNKRC